MKKYLIAVIVLIACLTPACGESKITLSPVEEKQNIIVGFSQVGAESDWRAANTNSMKTALSLSNGIELIFEDAQQKQTNQITSIRNFIQQEVDYIVLAPVTETGWDTVLREAKDAGIPVIIVDRMVNVSDDSLFTCWVGSGFETEALKICGWLNEFADKNGISAEQIHIADIQGTIGASAQIGRTKGLEDSAKRFGWHLVTELPGEFTKAKGYEAMKNILENYPSVNVVYCENDNEAFGAIEAIEDAGRTAGSDILNGQIMILSFDGVKAEGMRDVLSGRISCIAECNPLHGPRVLNIINLLENNVRPEKYTYVDEEIFACNDAITSIMLEGGNCKVTLLTPEIVNERTALFGNNHYTEDSPSLY